MKTEIHNYVTGFDVSGEYHLIRPHDAPRFSAGQHLNMTVDFSMPVTLARCREILAEASKMVRADLAKITIHNSEYTVTPGNECNDAPEQCLRNKKYHYEKRTNCLVIEDMGKIVYINEGGSIMRGDDAAVAYADSLDI